MMRYVKRAVERVPDMIWYLLFIIASIVGWGMVPDGIRQAFGGN